MLFGVDCFLGRGERPNKGKVDRKGMGFGGGYLVIKYVCFNCLGGLCLLFLCCKKEFR